ncbi:MAG: hypothetical protein CM15mP22_8300 [Gammaproteobacteria bacterium]|nr:MAG: hypothetical protein CM15mP22_8300 [Gammaproteobacteria bacterium]
MKVYNRALFVIGPDVVIAEDCQLKSHVVLQGPQILGQKILLILCNWRRYPDLSTREKKLVLKLENNDLGNFVKYIEEQKDLGYTKIGDDPQLMPES